MVNFEPSHEIQKKKVFRVVMNVEQRKKSAFPTRIGPQTFGIRAAMHDHRATENSGELGHFKDYM